MRRDEEAASETLAEMILGILLYGIVVLIIGEIIFSRKLLFLLGLIAGLAGAVYIVINMYDTLNVGLSMSGKDAAVYVKKKSILRFAIMLVISVVTVLISRYVFAGAALGLFGSKVSGLLNSSLHKFVSE